jgi:hypothetical protein
LSAILNSLLITGHCIIKHYKILFIQSSTSSIDTCIIPALRSPFQTHKMNLLIVACQRSCIRWVLPIQCTTVTCKEAGVAHKLRSQHCLPNKICT